MLYVSIIGVDRVPLKHYRAKLATEKIVEGSGIPYTILRVSQFYPFAVTLLERSSRLGPVVVDPAFLAQPVDVADVAGRIAGLLDEGPARGTLEFAGPRIMNFGEAAATWLAARGDRRRVVRLRVPGKVARAMRDGELTTTATPTGTRTWEDYLAARY
ncbi:hypothetical protein Aab01nite_56510 [Paractinoplanes abujensis]|uniref:Uncharacterized protein YbjT (DUF2867 family) n=1 Tax=Paractinoplanes abujensis TaxID=882441 RepID=A0A7W7CWT3_9ACTN|nr:hypothetical protein [Actinoplanes abujensis]MBB4696073.1 uncharacterized protein YbjT (DUF2867 family) [Actinoplanes abujensis]GID22061.1 hypothetical protein Aab01nite_56510 [Actinoplanes abujensis]